MPEDLLTPDDSSEFILDYSFTVLDSYWSTPAEERTEGGKSFDGDDKVRLYWHVRPDEVFQDYDGKVPETMTVNWTTGTGWVIQEDESQVRHKDDDPDADESDPEYKPKRFKASCMLGQFLGLVTGQQETYRARKGVRVMDGGDEDELTYDMTPAKDYLIEHGFGDPRDASIWVGTQWRSRGLGLDYGNDDMEVRAKALPVMFLGVDPEVRAEADAGVTPSATGAPEARGGVTASDVQAGAPFTLGDSEAEALARLVTTSTSHPQFMRQALALPFVKEDDAVKAWVQDADGGAYTLK